MTIHRLIDIYFPVFYAGSYHIGFANNSENGIAMSKQGELDLVLIDVVMLGLNGSEATRMIVKDKETMHIPVIICSAKRQPTACV